MSKNRKGELRFKLDNGYYFLKSHLNLLSLCHCPFRRLPYMDLPFDVQQEIVHAVFANFKSAQTNLERGNIAAYALGSSSKADKRWPTLQFPSDAMSVSSSTGEVRLYPNYSGSDVDTRLYVRDRFLRMEGITGTSKWGKWFLCGKNTGGKHFSIRYDSLFKRWYLILTYDALQQGAPFRPRGPLLHRK